MVIKVIRRIFLEDRTISDLYINDTFFCNVLEDTDRDLNHMMEYELISSIKKYGATAIPYGQYVLNMSFSNRFQALLPELMYVPGFSGIRIHAGNKPEDTHGCLLPGIHDPKLNIVKNSRVTCDKLFSIIKKANKVEKIIVSIESGSIETNS